MKTKYTAIDLFSGCGGLTLGLKLAGFKVLAAIEKDTLAVQTYKANHADVVVCHDDIVAVKAGSLRKRLNLAVGELDLLAGCPPCQGFSALRTRNGATQKRDKRNGLITEMMRFTRAFRPKTVMMENVPGLAEHWSFKKLCRDLRNLGYRVEWDIKDARYYGVPQRRKRLILVAGHRFDVPLAKETNNIKTVWEAIGGLKAPGHSRDKLQNLTENRSEKVLSLIRAIPKDGGSRTDLPKSWQLACHQRTDGFKDIYGRMAWHEPAPTITGGCFNPSKGRFLHPEANRAITLREAAILQSFPRRYRFPADRSKESIALMIGNALPPTFIRRHASEIAKSLANAKARSRRAAR
ncbi:DNA cytosine methyltransferase [[Pseudomonas] carboxydohydrogena]|uniref:Cytosine-specific methyltransferase n=1 Tax=Afipia carboxydohydrogena TaxID=290 RepID=A0ABY8BNB1_AFICR|nr:DNA cytosine methyltransferase [[Pseudomonas] carboxydohydrogena]WEF51433.1 DNA cytosine methyltransferase [[Pseudomonas] carboxydohydrogena]